MPTILVQNRCKWVFFLKSVYLLLAQSINKVEYLEIISLQLESEIQHEQTHTGVPKKPFINFIC